jgi:hypothetical protein
MSQVGAIPVLSHVIIWFVPTGHWSPAAGLVMVAPTMVERPRAKMEKIAERIFIDASEVGKSDEYVDDAWMTS